ncbi:MAG: M1 family aminopeptidase [Thermoanaerobaculia bacterium]
MLIDILRFEWRYHTRQVSFVAGAALFFALGLVFAATGYGPENVHVNSPYSITQSIGLLSLVSIFLLAVFCSNAVVRDRELRTEELVFATPVRKLDFLGGRFGGSILAAMTAFSFSALGMLLALALPSQDPSRIGPIELLHYLWALGVMAFPNILVAGVILFAIATLSRSVLASYVGAVFVYVMYFVGASLASSPLMAASAPGAAGEMSLAALVDPFGLSAFFEQTRFWTPGDRETRLVALEGNFLLNRAGWLAISALAWAVLYRLFAFRVIGRSSARAVTREPSAPSVAISSPRVIVTPSAGARADRAALGSATLLEVKWLLGNIPFLALNLLWAALAASEIVAEVAGGEYGSALIPTTGIVLSTIQQPLMLIATVVLIYFSGEIAWRERATSVAAMLDATPAPSLVFVISKWLGLCAMIVTIVATGSVVGSIIQVARGGAPIDFGVMLAYAWFAAAPLAIFAAAAIAVHAASPGKYAGLFILVLLAFYIHRGSAAGLDHHLLRFGSAPGVVHTEMNGFGHFVAPFNAYIMVWAAVAAVLLLAASLMWRQEPGARRRSVRRTLGAATPAVKVAIGLFAAIAVASGAWVFYNTNVVNSWESRNAQLDWKADYEKRWKRIASLPQPRIAHVEAKIDLRPEDRSYRLRGRYELVNDTNEAIPGVFVAVRRDASASVVSMVGAKLGTRDDRFGQYRFDLERPLQPGGRAELRFELDFANPGFVDEGPDTSIVANGSWIPSWLCLPTIGYRRGYELSDPVARRKRGLPPADVLPGSGGDLQDTADIADDWVTFDFTLSTAPDQIAITSGRLEREWEENGRRFFHYKSEAAVVEGFDFISARYEVAKRQHGNVSVEVYYHPGHDRNVERMLRAAVDTLEYMEANVGPYPFRQLRIVEIPSYWSFGGHARADTIVIVDRRGFLKDTSDPDRLDIVYRRVAHEVAHQWWGHRLSPATAAGASMLVESLTKYTELMVMRRALGEGEVRKSLVYELDRYLSGRGDQAGDEPPLDRVANEAHIYYGKGALVMHAIADLIGEDAVNRALRDLYAEKSGPGHAATTADLKAKLLAAAPNEARQHVEEWLSEVVLYDVGLESVASARRADGRWDVTLRVRAAKSRVGKDGAESAIPMREAVTIAIHGAGEGDGKLLVSSKREIRDGLNELSFVVAEEPSRAIVDPMLCLIDKNRFDNEKQAEGERR